MAYQYAHVFLLNACQKVLTYAIPECIADYIAPGSIVQVPLRNRHEYAIVQTVTHDVQQDLAYIKYISADHTPIQDPQYVPFLDTLCRYYAISRNTILSRLRKSLLRRTNTFNQNDYTEPRTHENTDYLYSEQQHIVDTIAPQIETPTFYPALIHGVTGSGKTHVYTALTERCIAAGNVCVWLVPEVTLAIELEQRVRSELTHIPCYGFHSASATQDKRAVWQAITHKTPCVIIGVHMPMLLPIPHLGCIIIDEEHDAGFQEKKHPKINSKEAAIMRAKTYNIPVIMGSATPSMQAMYNADHGMWKQFTLSQRYNGTIAPITIAHLTKREKRSHFWVTRELETAIRSRLARREQVLIFLNRRGYNFFLRCGSCGHTCCCDICSVSLTVHQDHTLRCHYCHRMWPEPQQCPGCNACSSHFIRKGIGTQQAVTILRRIFPDAVVARADLDTTVNKKKWRATLDDFQAGNIDILVGTQTITKGYHFPGVTLVGMLWADINLGMPRYDTAERTLQQMLQVAGRAGRESHDSHVIAQVMIDHTLYTYLHEEQYPAFYTYEMGFRQQLGYPPAMRFAAIELRNTDETKIAQDAQQVCNIIRKNISDHDTHILGPTPPVVSRIEGIHMRMIYIKSPRFTPIHHAYRVAQRMNITSRMHLIPHPSD